MTSQEQHYRNRKGEYTFLLFLQHTNEVVNTFDVFLPVTEDSRCAGKSK